MRSVGQTTIFVSLKIESVHKRSYLYYLYICVAYNISTVHAIRNMSRVNEYLRVSFSQDC